MAEGLARVGDRTFGTCTHPSHDPAIEIGGTITAGSTDFLVNGIGGARTDDPVLTDCGHTDLIIAGSADVTANNKGVARVGDSVGKNGIYFAVITTGSTDVTTP